MSTHLASEGRPDAPSSGFQRHKALGPPMGSTARRQSVYALMPLGSCKAQSKFKFGAQILIQTLPRDAEFIAIRLTSVKSTHLGTNSAFRLDAGLRTSALRSRCAKSSDVSLWPMVTRIWSGPAFPGISASRHGLEKPEL